MSMTEQLQPEDRDFAFRLRLAKACAAYQYSPAQAEEDARIHQRRMDSFYTLYPQFKPNVNDKYIKGFVS